MKKLLVVGIVVVCLLRTLNAQQSNRGFYRGGLSSGYILFFVHTNGALAVYTSDFGQTTSGGGQLFMNTNVFSFDTVSPDQTTTSTVSGTLVADSVSGNFTPHGSPLEAFTATKVPIFGPTAVVAGRYYGVCKVQPTGSYRSATILLDSQGRLVFNGIGSDSISNIGVQNSQLFPETFGADLAPEFHEAGPIYNVTGPSTHVSVNHGVMEGTFTTGGVTYEFRASKESSANQMANISTRGFVGTGDSKLIAGIIITGGPKLVLIRALGPSVNVSPQLSNPMLQLFGFTQNSIPIAVNDDWQTNSNAADISATRIPPTHPEEAALLVRLEAGSYTAVVSGADGGTGNALVEAYGIDGD